MLKIKDGVDLKELEKFGFENGYDEDWWFYKFLGDSFPDCEPKYWCGVCEKNGEDYDAIERVIYNWEQDIPNVVYDLITAGLVEKVEEE